MGGGTPGGARIPVMSLYDWLKAPDRRDSHGNSCAGDGRDRGVSDISELEGRIASALDRISSGLSRLGAAGPAALEEELTAEREANAQLEARVRGIKEKQDAMIADVESQMGELKQALGGMDSEIKSLRSVNDALRSSNAQLREANAGGLADAGLVNAALAAELEALRALEDGNRAEIDRALGLLEPMVQEMADA